MLHKQEVEYKLYLPLLGFDFLLSPTSHSPPPSPAPACDLYPVGDPFETFNLAISHQTYLAHLNP
jgi:hypothetical protein